MCARLGQLSPVPAARGPQVSFFTFVKYLPSIHKAFVIDKYLLSNSKVYFRVFVEANHYNPPFSLILELMELENIVANTVYLKVIFLSHII